MVKVDTVRGFVCHRELPGDDSHSKFDRHGDDMVVFVFRQYLVQGYIKIAISSRSL